MPEEKNIHILPLIFFGIILGLLLKSFIVDVRQVLGSSMEKTIPSDSVIIVNRLAFGINVPFKDSLLVQWKEPELNDIVIFKHDKKIVVKRCAACAGCRLDYSTNSGYSLVTGGKKIKLTQKQYERLHSYSSVPDSCILAIGDNYEDSIDSRDYGFIPVKNVLGKVLWK